MPETDYTNLSNIFIVGISGGSCSGKTTFLEKLNEMGSGNYCTLFQDWYYKDQSEKFDYDGGSVNFDHPDSLDFQHLSNDLKELQLGREIQAPIYDFELHKRLNTTRRILPKKVILIDGTLILHSQIIRELCHLKIFIECEYSIRLKRRLKRDVEERGRTIEGVNSQFSTQVEPMHQKFVAPSKSFADIIVTQSSFDSQLLQVFKKISDLK